MWRPCLAPLQFAMVLTLVLAGATSATGAGDAPSGARIAREVFELVNRHRAARGLPALALDPRIAREAQRHSTAMATGSRPFGHGGFPDRVAALRRVMSCGSSAENVGSSLGYRDPVPEVVRGWLASSGHRSTIEGRYDATGIGVARSATGKLYVTQIFVEM